MSLRDSKTQKLVITVALCTLAGWAYFLSDLLPFGYQVQAKKTKELRVAQETVSTELEKARRTVGNLPQLEKEQVELERKWTQAETLLPTDKEMAQLLTQITQAGEQAGVTFETFKPAPQKPQEFYNENPVEIEVKGGFHQVGVFLSRLANLSRIVNVTNLQLEGSNQKSRAKSRKDRATEGNGENDMSDKTLTASFIATAYSLRDPAAELPQGAPAEAGARKKVQQASVGHGAKATPGAITKTVSDKARKSGEGAE